MARMTLLVALSCFAAMIAGCASPYARDRGTAAGGALGAATGAIVGHQTGSTLGGAVVGGALGAVAGNMIGGAVDEAEARNRWEIERRMGQSAPRGATTVDDIIAMTHAGVDPEVISQHINLHGMARPLQPADMIRMQHEGVPKIVMQAAQRPPVVQPGPVPAQPPTYIVQEHVYAPPPCYHPRYIHYRRHHHRPRVGWGVSFSSGH